MQMVIACHVALRQYDAEAGTHHPQLVHVGGCILLGSVL